MFLKKICYPHQGCFYLIRNSNKKYHCDNNYYYKNCLICLNRVIHFGMVKLNLQQPLIQSSVSHDPLEIILMC